MTTSPNTAPILPVREFRANSTFLRWPALLVGINAVGLVISIAMHQVFPVPLFGAMGLAFLVVLVSAATLRVTMDADGLGQRWIWGRRRIAWHEIAFIERVKGTLLGDRLFLLNEKNVEIFAVSTLPLPDQELITEHAVKHARLRRDKKPLKRGVVARWVRK